MARLHSRIMIFQKTDLEDAYLIQQESKSDERGFFARAFCAREFAQHGLANGIAQINNSLATKKGTLRGFHYQLPPKSETKIVRCIRGALFDVIIDLRPGSPTFERHYGAELSADNRTMMYVPKGFAHAFITLTDDCEAFYLVDEFYSPDSERGIRWDDPKFAIEWPIRPTVISEKDSNHPDFDPKYHLKA